MTDQSTSSYSHPEMSVRHSYPLAEKSAGFTPALALCLKTMPIVLLRAGILLAFTAAAVIWLALCGGIALLFSGKDSSGGGLFLFLIGFGIPAGVFYWLRRYVLYLIKLAHVAVLTKLITEGTLPAGVNQVAYGKQIVTEKFTQLNVFFAVDALIAGVTRAFNRTLDWVAEMLPIPGLDGLVQVVNRIVHNATTFIDETIFSYNLARSDENIWRSSADGLVYYAQNAKEVLKTAVWCLVINYALLFGTFLICLLPAKIISLALPASVASWAWLFAAFLTYIVSEAFLHPLFLTMVALTFHQAAHEQPINEQYSSTLSAASDKFQELQQKAQEWFAPESAAKAG